MNSANKVLILVEDDYVSFGANALEKDINPSLLLATIGK